MELRIQMHADMDIIPVPVAATKVHLRIRTRRLGTQAMTPERAKVEPYVDLLKKALTRSLFDRAVSPVAPRRGSLKWRLYRPIERALGRRGLVLARSMRLGPDTFAVSPPPVIRAADTLIGPVGLGNIEACVEDVLERDVPGDLIEAGVWRGGSAIFMRGLLDAFGDTSRTVWAADSFQGMPEADPIRYPGDAGEEDWTSQGWLAISLDEVREAFARYGLLDDRVRFLPGWFKDTLPNAPIEQLAVMRLDGDMYSSTMDALQSLYPKLSVGGYVIIDDYWLAGCKAAVDEYRADHGITEELVSVDRAIVYWQRRHEPTA